jgi:hypothetical protein
LITTARKVPDAGSPALRISRFENLILTVLDADTHAVKIELATIEPLGTPIKTASPSAAPVTVIVKSLEELAPVLGKFSVAVALNVGE